MEVKINKEIRNYTESIFFGLSLRQFFFSVLACIVAVFIYFSLHNIATANDLHYLCRQFRERNPYNLTEGRNADIYLKFHYQ